MPNAATTDADSRVPWLDGMRGVAILLVMASHLTLLTAKAHPSRFSRIALHVAGGGWVGVDLFFVLSGMLITGILLDTKGAAGYWRRFYVRRILRIFPVYYAFLVVAFLLAPLLYADQPKQIGEFRHAVAWFSIYQTNIWIALRGAQNIDIFGTIHLWSLSVEEQFYFVWPFVVLVLSRRGLTYVSLGLVAFAALLRFAMTMGGVHPMIIYTSTPTRCDTLAIGALLAIAIREQSIMAAIVRYGRGVMAVSAAVILVVCFTQGGLGDANHVVQVIGLTPIALLFGGIVAEGLRGGVVSRLVARRFLIWAGRYSYALYLLHWPIAAWLALELGLPERLAGAGVPGLIVDPLFWLIAATTSCGAAWLSWNAIEKHFLKLKRYVRYDREVCVAPTDAPDIGREPLREAA